MKQALISPSEPIVNYDNTSGYRVAEVADTSFDIAEPLFWVSCNDEVQADSWYYDTNTSTCLAVPIPPIPVEPTP